MRKRKTRYFYDTEFHEDGNTIDLISIGIRCEDGREYYAVNRSADWARIQKHDWLVDNVLPYLPMISEDRWAWSVLTDSPLDVSDPVVKWKSDIAREVREFFLADGGGDNRDCRELWAWYAAYDHVALAQLWGRMLEMPDCVPLFTRDIKGEAERLGDPPRPDQELKEHHALADARHNEVMLNHFERIEAQLLSEASQRIACCPLNEETALEVIEAMRGWSSLP